MFADIIKDNICILSGIILAHPLGSLHKHTPDEFSGDYSGRKLGGESQAS